MSFLKPRRELTARQTSPAVRFNTCGGYLRDPTGHLCPNHKLQRFWTSKRMLILLRSSIWIRGYCPYAWGPYWSDKQNTMWRYEKARKLCYKRPHAVVVRQSRAGLDHQTNDRFKLYSGLARIDVEQCQEWVRPIRERSFASLLLPNYLHNGRHILLSMYINISPNKGISTGYLEVKSE